jgi:hypothetical protein
VRKGDRQHDAGKARARAEIHGSPIPFSEERGSGEGIQNVALSQPRGVEGGDMAGRDRLGEEEPFVGREEVDLGGGEVNSERRSRLP